VTRERRAGVVLCGGRSSRMGEPKHLLEIGGRTFLECCIAAFAGIIDQVIVSIAAGQKLPKVDPTILIIEDQHPEGGPLSGLAAAFPAVHAEHVAVLSCDAPLVKSDVVSLLFDAIGTNDAALPTAFGREQYFPAVYDQRVGGIAQRLLERNEHRMSAFIAECQCSIVSESQIRSLDPNLDSFCNVNTPDEYGALVRRFEGA
jgi:molybdenum cofactor guanylyltransferase